MITAAAGAPSTPASNAALTNGYLAGRRAPRRSLRGAVASPTLTRRDASPVDTPVAAAINVAGL
ncbi:hypothetical protein, partial [Microbacterium sp. Be9]|uniref:hypothetical protein n=1 Tax=Microbacterium sp. Be9 TaxID=2720211 RepID=UPI00326641A7